MSRNSRLSRIGSRPIDLHPDMLVALTADGSTLCVHGKLGTLRLPLSTRVAIEPCGEHSITLREKDVAPASPESSNGKSSPNISTSPNSTVPKLKNKDIKATLGLSRTLIQNMVTGVSEGFRKELMLTGVGYRAEIQTSSRANAKINNKSSSSNAADTRSAPSPNESECNILRLFVGYSHPVDLPIPTGIEVTVPKPTSIEVFGIEKDKVGHFASRIRKVRPPEPYKGKGISYVGEHIRRKLAKSKK